MTHSLQLYNSLFMVSEIKTTDRSKKALAPPPFAVHVVDQPPSRLDLQDKKTFCNTMQ